MMDDWDYIYIAIGVAAFVIVIVAVIACLCCCGKKSSKKRNAVERVSIRVRNRLSGIRKPEEGRPSNQYQAVVPVGGADHHNPVVPQRTEPRQRNRSESKGLIEDAIKLAMDSTLSNFIVDSKRLTFGEPIGKGHFGMVYKGMLTDKHLANPVEVAIKTVIDESSGNVTDVSGFIQEALRMKSFSHPNVLSIKGLVIKEDRPFVVMPIMKYGDLRSYVSNSTRVLVVLDLLKMAHQVACGMAYLAEHNFIHRDLAARNIMVDANIICKIADFGLSRELFDDDYYVLDDPNAPLPVKWMAIESLTRRVFTHQSDVWSFGIVMWELMTRGNSPYKGLGRSEIGQYVVAGHRPTKPQHCPPEIYNIMHRCWMEDPRQRPTFKQLDKELTKLTGISEYGCDDMDYEQPV